MIDTFVVDEITKGDLESSGPRVKLWVRPLISGPETVKMGRVRMQSSRTRVEGVYDEERG